MSFSSFLFYSLSLYQISLLFVSSLFFFFFPTHFNSLFSFFFSFFLSLHPFLSSVHTLLILNNKLKAIIPSNWNLSTSYIGIYLFEWHASGIHQLAALHFHPNYLVQTFRSRSLSYVMSSCDTTLSWSNKLSLEEVCELISTVLLVASQCLSWKRYDQTQDIYCYQQTDCFVVS